ncbi:MAG TPA: hypothetical protein VFX52_09180 [Nocardioidaceae bacterium]|nr:hypothetical protein [Nocardioidaceae bacterium]
MARMWTCGFELQSTTAEFGVNSGSVVTGAPQISTTVRRAGTASLRSNPTNATAFIEHQLTTGVVMRTFHRFYLRIDSLPSTATNVYGIGQSGYFPALLRIQPDGTLVLRDGFVETTLAGTSPALALGRWYRVELDYTDVSNGGVLAAGTAPFKGYLDGVQFADAMCSNITGFSRIRMGVQLAATTDIFIDDVAVNDTTGTVQNGLPGPGNVVHLRPNAAGDANGWATAVGGTAGAANNWTRVSERPPDDATSYNQTSATGTTTTDDFNIESPTAAGIGSGDSITLVQVGGRVASSATTAASIVYRLKGQAGGTVLESGSVSVASTAWSVHSGVSPRPYQLTAYTNPQNGAAWTAAALENAQIGYRSNVSQTTVRRVSNLWALVEFVPKAGTSQALGVATERDAGQALTGIVGKPFHTLQDDFNDNIVDFTKWPDTYNEGGYSEVDGRARVVCDTGYNAYGSAWAYHLRESSVHVRMWPPAAGGAPAEAWGQVLIKTATAGTDLVVTVMATTGQLIMAVRSLYYDPGEVQIPYDPVAHAWLRVRETGGQLLWDTSPDGKTWTTRRTATSPAWVANTPLQVQLIAHRDGGVVDFVEFDSFNTAPSQSASLATAAESGSALPVARRKTRALGTTSETGQAQALSGRRSKAVGVAGESDAALTLGRARARALTQGTEASAGQALARTKRAALAPAGTAGTARPLTGAKRSALGTAAETSAGQPLAAGRTAVLGTAGETTAALPVGTRAERTLTTAASVEEAQPVQGRKTAALQPAADISAARPLAGAKRQTADHATETAATVAAGQTKRAELTSAWEAAAALPLTPATGLPAVAETAHAQPLARAKRLQLGVVQAVEGAQPLAAAAGLRTVEETSTARPLGRAKTLTSGAASGMEEARPFGRAKVRGLGGAAEATVGTPLTGGKRRALAPALESGAAAPVLGAKARAIAAAGEVGQALEVAGLAAGELPEATERGAARPLAGIKTAALTGADEGEAAQPLTGRKAYDLETATAADTVRSFGRGKRQQLGTAAEVVQAQRLAVRYPLRGVEESSLARPLTPAKRLPLAAAVAADEAQPLGTQARLTAGRAVESAAGLPLARAKTTALAAAATVAAARPITVTKASALGVAVETSRALVGPQIRLTWAAATEQAMTLTGRRQRPADRLDPTTTGPALTPSTGGPRLATNSGGPRLAGSSTGPRVTASSSGPRLAASVTTGG